jgi:hypothetical protein
MKEVKELMRDAVKNTAIKMLKPSNKVTTLELKLQLRKDYPSFYWKQETVSQIMNSLSNENVFNFTDNGTFRTYSLVKSVKSAVTSIMKKVIQRVGNPSRITRKTAKLLIENSKGQFFTATFVKKDQQERTMNAQCIKGQKVNIDGLIKVTDVVKKRSTPNDCIRNLNINTLKRLKIGQKIYSIKK